MVQCKDDGVGFDMQKNAGPGVGIMNIKKRISEMMGQVEFFSKKGEGTRLTFYVPY